MYHPILSGCQNVLWVWISRSFFFFRGGGVGGGGGGWASVGFVGWKLGNFNVGTYFSKGSFCKHGILQPTYFVGSQVFVFSPLPMIQAKNGFRYMCSVEKLVLDVVSVGPPNRNISSNSGFG